MVSLAQVQSGDLLVWGKSFEPKAGIDFIKVVRFLTMSNFGHVSVAWRYAGDLYHVEAACPTIRKLKVPKVEELFYIPMGLALDFTQMADFFDDKIGLPYGYMDAVRAWLGITLKDPTYWQCAELALEFYRHNGLEVSDAFTPNLLVKALMREQNKPLFKLTY